MAEHNELGKLGEEMAVEFLRENGYTILETNWTFIYQCYICNKLFFYLHLHLAYTVSTSIIILNQKNSYL